MIIPTMTNSRSDPVCSHYQSQCLVRFPYCGKFFPRHRCHNESNCTEDQARAVNATPIRCTICYCEQVVRFYLRTEFKFSSLSFLMFSLTFYLFFLLNFFLLPKKMAILKMYLLVNLLTPSIVYRMHSVAVKFYPALTRFTKTVQLK